MYCSRSAVAVILAAAVLGGCAQGPGLEGPGYSLVTDVRSTPWDAGRRGGRELLSAHYRIYTNSSNASLVRYMPGFLEAAYRHYSELTGLDGPATDPMPVYLMNSRQDWESLTRSVIGPRAGTYLAIQSGGYCYRGVCVFWDIGNLATFTVAGHEGMHQFLHHRLKGSLPVWLEEGLCTQAEGYRMRGERVWFDRGKNLFRFRDLRVAIVDGHWMGLEKLLGNQPANLLGGDRDATVGYYGQLWALVSFIYSQPPYRAGMQRMLADAQAGTLGRDLTGPATPLALFKGYIAEDVPSFEREYRQYAKSLASLE